MSNASLRVFPHDTGEHPPAAQAVPPTPAGIMHYGRAIADDLGAGAFAICDIERSGPSGGLGCPWPENHGQPEFSPGLGEAIARHAGASTEPCCWTGEELFPLRPGSAEVVAAGIALPVYARQLHCGVVLFSGLRGFPSSEILCEVHTSCFTLYSAWRRMREAEVSAPPSISRRERECLKLTANGCTSEEIARLLCLSVHTANQYLTNSAQKLDAMSRTHAVAKALRLGLID